MNQLKSFAQDCINHYAHYDSCDEFYSLEVSDLPDFVKHEFAAMIIASNEAYACEATGPDNKHWDKKMLPALTRYLANSTEKDEAIEFNNVWRDCVTDYLTDVMKKLIDAALYDFNNDNDYIKPLNYYYGESARG